jgi:hypothetical protein
VILKVPAILRYAGRLLVRDRILVKVSLPEFGHCDVL